MTKNAPHFVRGVFLDFISWKEKIGIHPCLSTISNRSRSFTSFIIYYIILKMNSVNKSNKHYFSSINLWYSILTLLAVHFRPISIATSSQLSRLKNLYRIILCIRKGISFIHSSTSSFSSSA